jgi:hypothetical protein
MENGLQTLTREIIKFIKNDWDVVISIEGSEGVGKTDLACLVGMSIYKRFDFVRNIAYLPSLDDISDKFDSIERYGVLIIDEAIKVLYKMRALERLQVKLVEKYATERKQNKVTILCVPRHNDLNENFRNHRVMLRVWIPVRGVAIVYARDKDKDVKDPWHVSHSLEIKKRLLSKKVTEREIKEIIECERKTLNYVMDFEFPDMPPEHWDKYFSAYAQEKLREKDLKRHEGELEGTKLELYRIALSSMIKSSLLDDKKTQREVAEITGLSQKTISILSRNKNT